MRSLTTKSEEPNEAIIIARVLGTEGGPLSPNLARHILDRSFSEADKARMHDLATRNQDDALSKSEKRELMAYAKTGTLLSILKSQARRALRIRLRKPN